MKLYVGRWLQKVMLGNDYKKLCQEMVEKVMLIQIGESYVAKYLEKVILGNGWRNLCYEMVRDSYVRRWLEKVM